MKIVYLKILGYVCEIIGTFIIIAGFFLMFNDPSREYISIEIALFSFGAILLGIGLISHILFRKKTTGIIFQKTS